MAFFAVLATTLALATAVYAHYELPKFTNGRRSLLVSRLVLIVVGVAFGLVAAPGHIDETWRALAFLWGFGAVHAPAAFVLFIKRQRGVSKS